MYGNSVSAGYTEQTSFVGFRITKEKGAPFVPYVKNEYVPNGDLTLGIYDSFIPKEGKITRKTSSLVLTGTETWIVSGGAAEGVKVYASNVIDGDGLTHGRGICNRFEHDLTKAANSWSVQGGTYRLVFCFNESDQPTLSGWKEYLAQQYAAGTPVSIIYETSPVEETVDAPLGYTAYNGGTEQIVGNGVLPTITQTYSIHENPTEACTKGYVNNGLAKKLDKVGGTITGSLIVEGSTDTDLSALVVKNSDATYGLSYEGDAFKLGLGSVDDNNDFTFDENEGSPIALRADSSTFTDGHMVVWSADGNKLVDGGPAGSDIVYSPNGTMLSQKLDGDGSFEFVNEPANITSKQFTEATRVGAYSVTLGGKSAATGKRALAEGTSTWAEGNYSHAEGNKSYAKGAQAHAEGAQTYAFGDQSHAEGWKTYANGNSSHAEGAGTIAVSTNSHAEGQDGQVYGTAAHVEGNNSTVHGDYAHGEGDETYTQGAAAHAEGRSTRAEANYAHAEGLSSRATNTSAHAEGQSSNASGEASHAEGVFTVASGYATHAEGNRTEAIHDNSHAAGAYTRTSRQNQTVVGQANKDDENALFIVGNGYYEWPSFSSTNPTESNRKNAFAVMASSEPTIKVGSITLTETELQQMKSGGGSSGVSSWNDLTDKPFYSISESYPYFNYPASYGTVQIYGGNGGNLELRNPDFSIPYSEIAQMPITVGYFNAGNSAIYTTPNTVGGNENCWYILNNSAPIAGYIVAVCVNKAGTYTVNGISLTFSKTGLYFGAYGGYWYAESIEAIKPIDEKYLPKQNTLTIGNTTITEAQLQQLLALLNIQNAEEVEF